jgi:hypothetical protein
MVVTFNPMISVVRSAGADAAPRLTPALKQAGWYDRAVGTALAILFY